MDTNRLLPALVTVSDIEDWFRYLFNDLSISFHPDDSFADYINGQTRQDLFDPQTAALLDMKMEEAFQLCDTLNVDIYAIGLEIFRGHDMNLAMVASIISRVFAEEKYGRQLYESSRDNEVSFYEKIAEYAIEYHDMYKYSPYIPFPQYLQRIREFCYEKMTNGQTQ